MSKNTNRYAKVSVRMWGDDKFCSLSKPKPNGQTLWQYLITGPHKTALPSAFHAGEMSLAESLDWPLTAFRKVFQEVFNKGMVQCDWKARLVFIPNALKHNAPENPNVVKGWRAAFNELPDCPLKMIVFTEVKTYLESRRHEWDHGEAFVKAFGEDYVKVFGKTEQSIAEQIHSRAEQEHTEDPVRAFGQFGWVRLTEPQHAHLQSSLDGHADELIAEFDGWVQEAPDAKSNGSRRRDRDPYASIQNWYRRKLGEGKYGNVKASAAAANTRAAQDFVRRRLAQTVQPHLPNVREDSRE